MTKIKERLYEHRFGLLFFSILTVFGLVLSDPMRIVANEGVTYSFYCVDFSLGFCTKLLPGAIYSLLVGKYNETAISIYIKALIIIVFILIAFIFERMLKNSKPSERKEMFFFLFFAAAGIYFFFFEAGLVYLLDFHWIIAAVIFIICLSNKKLYAFIPFTLIYAVMTHYVSCICYVAACLLILLYKAYITENKKEKYFLFGIFGVSLAVSLALFAYMLFFEIDNVKISYPQFMQILKDRDVEQVDYYIFAFFREVVEDVFSDYYSEENIGVITNIDQNQSLINILFQTIVQQFRINAYLSDHKSELPKIFVFIPGLLLITGDLIARIKKAKVFEKLIYLVGIALFVFICVFGLVFSTDTVRWMGNAILTMILFWLGVIGFDKKERLNVNSLVSALPHGVYYFYLTFCIAFTLI